MCQENYIINRKKGKHLSIEEKYKYRKNYSLKR